MNQLQMNLTESVRTIVENKLPMMASRAQEPTPLYTEVAELSVHILKELIVNNGWEYDLAFSFCSEHHSWTGQLAVYKGDTAATFTRVGESLGETACTLIVAFNERILETRIITDIPVYIQ